LQSNEITFGILLSKHISEAIVLSMGIREFILTLVLWHDAAKFLILSFNKELIFLDESVPNCMEGFGKDRSGFWILF